ncbi:hypothetical protein ABZW96_37015 [Nocardia sp. NPDC004168]|uniref:hypothetical protein n=1 Tax=Nocardia sp. NPDC004168 TaxID=3154452 RepID=UPI00339E6BB8
MEIGHDSDMRTLALVLMGEFAKVQDSIDGLVGMYFARRTPGMQWYLKQKGIPSRIRDSERPRLVVSIAADLGTTSDLSNFTETYERLKEIRDYTGHSVRVDFLNSDTIVLTKQFFQSGGGTPQPSLTVTRQELMTGHRDALWLLHHVHYIIASSDLSVRTFLGDRAIRYVEPTPSPAEWDEVAFVFVDEVGSTTAGR